MSSTEAPAVLASGPKLLGLSRRSRLIVTGSDQLVSSSSNFVIGVLVGRLAGPAAYGTYILAFTIWLVVLGIHRALVTEPLVISGGLTADRQSALRRGLEADLLLAVGLGLVVAVVGGGLVATGSQDTGYALLVIAIAMPALLAQDYWRAMAFALNRPEKALVNDVIFVVVQLTAIVVVVAGDGHTAPWFLAAWGIGAAAGALAGFFQFGIHPFRRGRGPLFAHTWSFSRWLLADFLTIFAADQTYLLIVAGLLGQAAFGELRAAISLMGPTAVVLLTGGNIGLPGLSRANAERGIDGVVDASRRLTKLVGSAVLAYCAVVFVAGPWLVTLIYGDEFSSSGDLARISALTYAVAVGAFGAGISIRVLRQARSMWTARLVVTGVSVVAVLVLSERFGLSGAAWAGFITAVVGTGATLLVFRRYVARAHRQPAPAPVHSPWPPPIAAQLRTDEVFDPSPWPPPGPGAGMLLGLSTAEGGAPEDEADVGSLARRPR